MDTIIIDNIINYIKNLFSCNLWAKGVTLGMSGGKDSLIVAALCCKALGADKINGVIMPNGEMKDIEDAVETCKYLGIKYQVVDISKSYQGVLNGCQSTFQTFDGNLNSVVTINIAPRIRMTTLYAIAASTSTMVVNTSNLSEIALGYFTKWGDCAGDFALLANFTKTEVVEIGHLLGLPEHLVDKAPGDGLTGKSDEEQLGIHYENLDNFIRFGKFSQDNEKILKMYKNNAHKRVAILSTYDPQLPNFLKGV